MFSFRNSVRLSALSLLLVAGLAGAADATPINYNIKFSIGTSTVSGTIETDGTLGVLTPSVLDPSQILNWNLTLTDSTGTCAGGPCTIALAGPFGTTQFGGLQTDGLVGQDLFATSTQLYFDTSGSTPGELFFAGTPGGEVCIATGVLCTLNTTSNSEVRINPAHHILTTPAHPNGVDYQFAKLSGPLILGTATPVPEPSSLAIMAAGLALLGLFGFARFRKSPLRA